MVRVVRVVTGEGGELNSGEGSCLDSEKGSEGGET